MASFALIVIRIWDRNISQILRTDDQNSCSAAWNDILDQFYFHI